MKMMCVLPLSHYALLTDVCENFSIVLSGFKWGNEEEVGALPLLQSSRQSFWGNDCVRRVKTIHWDRTEKNPFALKIILIKVLGIKSDLAWLFSVIFFFLSFMICCSTFVILFYFLSIKMNFKLKIFCVIFVMIFVTVAFFFGSYQFSSFDFLALRID